AGSLLWLPGYLLAAHPWRDDRTQPAFLPAVAGQALLEPETLRPLVPLKVTNPERDNVSHPVRNQSLNKIEAFSKSLPGRILSSMTALGISRKFRRISGNMRVSRVRFSKARENLSLKRLTAD